MLLECPDNSRSFVLATPLAANALVVDKEDEQESISPVEIMHNWAMDGIGRIYTYSCHAGKEHDTDHL